ncbi:hypothetical protein IMG5_092670 [Ichthyophthirius multifiliis]|uniref:Transmembrane protein n=1 Tax=Ichthyophthirius multifiliis TaxID=5932 RepID=G0QRG5_ICHMU|nr:hypothetical protein IMG5_092670 [Ichthyophthirius multifiliis]EGR32200.1 hypothetical protein IMG5_092670 [Ichthyophthirius multifiliis]|eukprot:XP_004035686.1 hypothetical protein IMG5_092670 [Ichthyophthirius multifiliis]
MAVEYLKTLNLFPIFLLRLVLRKSIQKTVYIMIQYQEQVLKYYLILIQYIIQKIQTEKNQLKGRNFSKNINQMNFMIKLLNKSKIQTIMKMSKIFFKKMDQMNLFWRSMSLFGEQKTDANQNKCQLRLKLSMIRDGKVTTTIIFWSKICLILMFWVKLLKKRLLQQNIIRQWSILTIQKMIQWKQKQLIRLFMYVMQLQLQFL